MHSEFDQTDLMTIDPEPATFGVDASSDPDTAVLRLAAINLTNYLHRVGVPQSSTRQVVTFAKSWNAASASNPLQLDGKYTQEIQAALDAALRALAPSSLSAPQAIL